MTHQVSSPSEGSEEAASHGLTAGQAGPQYPPPPLYAPHVMGQPPQSVSVDNSFAWALAFAPLLLVLIDGLFAATGAGFSAVPAFLAAIGLNVGLSLADHRRVRATGQELPAALAALLVPVYLFLRQARLRQNYAIPIVWCVTFLASLGGSGIIENTIGVAIDTGVVERQIEQGVQNKLGTAVTVQCPSSVTVRTGESFQCVVQASDGSSAIAKVTIQNSQGDFVWQVG
ncbi:DUF4333 domain-containing protein [Streptomyces sp. NPDC005283]|uniref:DUF4333 domain-containing protein n=1 Tax=Streptomyces sp. NPDC005283 TaxID=3156871 RepID=UPI0034522172